MQTTRALPAELTIYTVAEVRGQLLGWLQDDATADGPLRLDASPLAEIDGAGVQLLLSLARSVAALGRSLQLLDAPGPLRAACERLGLPTLIDTEAVA